MIETTTGYSDGFAAGLAAAREAVLTVKVIDDNTVYVEDEATHFAWKRKALAAIDALQEKP